MKKILAFIIGASFLFSSCQDWLEVGSETELTEENVFSDESGFHKALTGVYIGMGDPSLYGGMLTWRMLDYYAHYYYNVSGSNDTKFHTHAYSDAYVKGHIKNIWNGLYKLIANCNNTLEHLEAKKDIVHPLSYSLMKGELLTLRAFLHFDLLRMFGHGNYANRVGELSNTLTIPYVTTFSKEIPAQCTYAEIFTLLKKDLNEAIQLMWGENGENCIRANMNLSEDEFDFTRFEEANGDDSYFFTYYSYYQKPRIDYYVAKAILARVMMWEGAAENYDYILDTTAEWTLAETDSNPDAWDWTRAALMTTSEMYKDRIFANEAMWILGVQDLYSKIGEGSWFLNATQYEKCVLSKAVANDIYEYETGNNTGASDWRRTYLLQANGNYYELLKLDQVRGETNYRYKNQIPMVGTAELYYMSAEVSLKKGSKTDACAYLNKVRRARGITTDLVAAELTEEEVMAEIQKEARKEFVCLGQMFYFYKRLGVTNIPNYTTTEMTDELYMFPYPDDEVITGNRVQKY